MDPFRSLKRATIPAGHFVGEGHKVVRRMLSFSKVEKILLSPSWHRKLTEHIPPSTEVEIRPDAELREIVGFRMHQGVVALARIPDPPPVPTEGVFVGLDGVSDAENVGAILRTCAAFGVSAVFVGSGTCSPWTRRAIRVSMAAPLRVPVYSREDLAGAIRASEFPWYAAHIHGPRRDVRDVRLSPPCGIVLGGEANGVSAEVLGACRETVHIPMSRGWDCLNVAAGAAVLLYEVARK